MSWGHNALPSRDAADQEEAGTAQRSPHLAPLPARQDFQAPPRITAADWHAALHARYAEPFIRPSARMPFATTVFIEQPRDIAQPALVDDVFSVHLGGAKRVHRTQDNRRRSFDVALKSFTLMPRHQPADWSTEGPVGFAHVTLKPRAFDDLIISERGRTRSQIDLIDRVGEENGVLVGLALEMVRVANEGSETQLYIDTLFTAFSLALLRHCSGERNVEKLLSDGTRPCTGGMAGWRLRQIVDFMMAHQASDIGLDDLTRVSGLSRAHFFRAFRQATGVTPGRYLMRLRVETALREIESGHSLAEAASVAGFSSNAAMSHAFRRVLNITPELYRRWYR